MTITEELFGNINNEKVSLFTLNNDNIVIKITNYGGIITSIMTPNKKGIKEEITLGFNSLNEYTNPSYVNNCPYFGALIGRYANRIGKGLMKIENKNYDLAINNGENHLHGGPTGFHAKVWNTKMITDDKTVQLELSLFSPDGDENYPGNLNLKVTYTLNDLNELTIDYEATTDKSTHVNFTNHTYFNLTGCKTDVLNHIMQINAATYTEVDEHSIPTGKIIITQGTEMDFTSPTPIGKNIQKVQGRGYDHNYIIGNSGELKSVAKTWDPESGRLLETFSTEPGVQLYTGNYLDGTLGRINKEYTERFGFCLETQHFPDSPNKPQFPNTLLKPNEIYTQKTVYKFSTI